MRFENQVAVVTGAGRGIGHAIALRLAKEGARVACVSRSEANAQRTADEINVARPDAAKPYAWMSQSTRPCSKSARAFWKSSAAWTFS